METSAFLLAQRFVGVKEVAGQVDNPMVMAMLRLDNSWPQNDETPWCSAFANFICWLIRLPRSKDLRARSWLQIGSAVSVEAASPGFDVVILKRGNDPQPGPDVIDAPGHVGFFAGMDGDRILMLGGNQNNEVNVTSYPKSRILGIRRLV